MVAGRDPGQKTKLYRLSGIGFELLGSIMGGGVLGWYYDRELGTSYGLITGLTIGIVGGLYNLIRRSLRIVQDESKRVEPQDRLGDAD
jgi:F0F1-type ATP synthase assembly protein I